ncbi:Transcription antitermination protein RfaH [subsurface metagenome]
MLKLSDNPSILSPCVDSLTELSGRWWVAHTKARFEKAFAWELHHRDIGYFLPMAKRVRIYRGKKQSVMLPLFTSYVFFCGTEMDRYQALATNRLCQTIEVFDQENLILQLSAIEKALLYKADLDTYPHLPIGAHCRITSGPMIGTEGIIIERKDAKARMVLEITILGQGAVIEIDSDLLEIANS